MPSGIIIKGIGGFYYVSSEDGIYECKARGIFRKEGLTPLTGDQVVFSISDPLLKKGSIEQISGRSSLLVRPAVANVNQLVAVMAAKSPDPDLLLLDKLLVTAEKNEMKAVLCINKIDLDIQGRAEAVGKDYSMAGYTVILTSSKANTGFDELKAALNGHISVFAGQSGVGKSTILNRIMNTMVMKTGSISDKIERGKHTTRHAELILLEDGGYVADTPGFSSFEIAGISHTKLQYYFPEFADHIGDCRYTGCSHINEPGCSIKQAVEEKTISRDRYERYVELYSILKQEDSTKYRK